MKPDTERDYRRRIGRVVEAILADPAAPHSVDSLAATAHLSPFHFHRIYRAMTGEGLADTLRRVRLAMAARLLAGAEGSVTDIALDVGYGSPQSFARAFRDVTGWSPSEFQQRQQSLADVTLVERPPVEALCLRHDGPVATILHSYRALWRRLGLAEDGRGAGQPIGIARGDPAVPNGFSYWAGVVPAVPIAPVPGVETILVAGGLYAAYRLLGAYELIAPSFETLFGTWLPQSGYEPDDRPALELYHTAAMSPVPQDCVTDLLIPIRKPLE
jgi:AraC family transcriptional regulator